MFNIDDIPLYEAIAGKARMGTIDAFIKSIITGAAISTQRIPGLLESHKNFIRFFERDISLNLRWFQDQLQASVQPNHGISEVLKRFGYDGKRIVVTPLVMDFDKSLLETDVGRDVMCIDQIRRLFHAIAECSLTIEVYPFMGFALNKLDGNLNELGKLQTWWKSNGLMRHQRVLGKESPLPSGKAIGIKLYPPLGFTPCPEGQAMHRYLEFYKWCIEEDIPVTVHCQKSSFTTTEGDALIDNRTNPSNWEKLFDQHPELAALRINFGHFGGSDELIAMMKGIHDADQRSHLNNSWTLTICRLLCKYRNTYADISAFGLESREALRSLALLLGGSLDLPSNAWLPNLEVIAEKIIWGSDVPMIMSSRSFLDDDKKPSYRSLLDKLLIGLTLNAPFNGIRQTDAQVLFNRITRSNSAEFLFGGT